MDFGSISLLEKQSNGTFVDPERKVENAEESATTNTKLGKSKVSKEIGHSTLNSVNKSTAQIKKPSRRKSSPINWFPRKKTDSYLNRKIRLLQEVDGMNSTLDETLGDSNPHYSRVLREKIAAREAAQKAVEARKAELVEASWCRILRAARIESKDAEALLLKAEKNVDEAFEAATAIGVIMYDRQDCPRKSCEIDASSVNRGGSTTHAVTASFETAFEVDKEVAAAVKTAFMRLAHCPSSLSKDEFKELLRTISQNPDTKETNQELPDLSLECESDTGSELESESPKHTVSSHGLNCKMPDALRERKSKNQQLPQNINTAKLVDMMFDRLKCLQEDELASLATIVATCGLNAALMEVENSKQHSPDYGADYTLGGPITSTRNLSSYGAGRQNMEYFMDGQMKRKQLGTKLPSLDKFLVKHMSRLEREVQEAKNLKSAEPKEALENKPVGSEDRLDDLIGNVTSSEAVPDLGSVLVKHSSKLEKEIEDAKEKSRKGSEEEYKGDGLIHQKKKDLPDVPSLDKFLVKHVSKLEREVQEARKTRTGNRMEGGRTVADSAKVVALSFMEGRKLGKENRDSNEGVDGKLAIANSTEYSQSERAKMETAEASSLEDENGAKETGGLDSIFVKRVHRLEREKSQALASRIDYGTQKKQGKTNVADCESLDKVLVKHVSRLEREKMELGTQEEVVKASRRHPNIEKSEGGLEHILVKHQSRLEKEKLAAAHQSEGDETNEEVVKARRRHPNIEKSEGGLEQILAKHQSRLEKEKLAAAHQSEGDETNEEVVKARRRHPNIEKSEGGLEQILAKHQSRLEKEKLAAAQESGGDQTTRFESLRDKRERELREAWGGLCLGNSMRPHLSRLERDKAAWIKAEEEQTQARVAQ